MYDGARRNRGWVADPVITAQVVHDYAAGKDRPRHASTRTGSAAAVRRRSPVGHLARQRPGTDGPHLTATAAAAATRPPRRPLPQCLRRRHVTAGLSHQSYCVRTPMQTGLRCRRGWQWPITPRTGGPADVERSHGPARRALHGLCPEGRCPRRAHGRPHSTQRQLGEPTRSRLDRLRTALHTQISGVDGHIRRLPDDQLWVEPPLCR